MAQTSLRLLRRLAVAAVVIVLLPPSSVRAETLADTLIAAYNHSGLLDQNRALLRAADEDVAQTVSELRPILNWSADFTRSFGHTRTSILSRRIASTDVNIGLEADLLLYDFGRTDLRIEAAKETVLSTRQTLRSIEQQVLLRAVQAFMNVRRNREFVSLRENNVRLLRQELRAARDRFEVGEVTRTDVAQAEARLAAAHGGQAEAQGDLVQAIEEFRSSTGRKPGVLQVPKILPRLSGDIEGSKLIAVRDHPDILRIRHRVSAADLTVSAAQASVKPRISLNGRLSAGDDVNDSDFSRTGSVGIRVTGPIYQGGLLSSAIRQAMAQRDSARGELHDVRHTVAQNVGNAYAVFIATQASRRASQEQVRAADVAFRGVQEEAKLGARTTLVVLDAEQELLDARTNLISADTDVTIAAYNVLASLGQLTAKDLKLNVQTYDPGQYYNLVKDAPVPISPQGQKLDKVLRALGKE